MNRAPKRLTGAQVEHEALFRLQQLTLGFKALRSKKEVRCGASQPDLVVDIRYKDKGKTLLMDIESSGEPAFLYKAMSRLHLASGR